MRDRLTERLSNDVVKIIGWDSLFKADTDIATMIDRAIERLAQYEDTGVTPNDVANYKELYIDMLKEYDDDLCGKCKNNPHVVCDKTCPDYVEGRGGTFNGRYVNFAWSCLDFDYGDCPRLENTLCYKCFDNGFDHFELEE